MDTTLLTSAWVEIVAHGIATVAAFVGAMLLSSALRKNKGAEANRAWSFIAIGLILLGLSEASRTTAQFGFPLLEDWDGVMIAIGSLFSLFGVMTWLALVKKALR